MGLSENQIQQDRTAGLFDAYYFAHSCGHPYGRSQAWLRFFESVATRIVADIHPGSVLDAGCAMGLLVESLRDRGVEAFGVDVSAHAIDKVRSDIRPYCRVGSVADELPRRYDLIVCVEVLEHLPQSEAEKAVANFCRHTDDVLFSSSPLDYREVTHFNVQPPEYWAELFARHGFFRDVDFDAAFIAPWSVRFRRRNEPLHRLVREYERRFWQLWQENHDLRSKNVEMQQQLAAQETSLDQLSQVQAERDHWRDLAHGYAQGRLMRLLAWLQRMQQALARRVR